MILVDSFARIDHLRAGESALVELLNTGQVLTHPLSIPHGQAILDRSVLIKT